MIMEKTLNKCLNNMMDEMIFAIAVLILIQFHLNSEKFWYITFYFVIKSLTLIIVIRCWFLQSVKNVCKKFVIC